MGFNDDYLDPDGFFSTFDDGPCKWRVFRERVPDPMWVVWDETGEFLFRTGAEALGFVNWELKKRALAQEIKGRQEKL